MLPRTATTPNHTRLIRRGFSLIELACVLAVIALLLAGVMLMVQQATDARNVREMFQEVLSIESIYEEVCASYPAMDLDDTTIANTGMLPAKWVNPNGGPTAAIINPWNNPVTVLVNNGPGGEDELVINETVPVSVCAAILTKDEGADTLLLANSFSQNNQSTVSGNGGAISPSQAATICSQAAKNPSQFRTVSLLIVHNAR